MSKGPMDDYVDVAERVQQFYAKYPDGRLTRVGDPTTMEINNKVFLVYTAKAYRTADDPVPAVGTAWEPVPGPTNFTRDSELMNAETAAWGRAIIAVGIPSKKIASSQEVQARREPRIDLSPKKPDTPKPKPATSDIPTEDVWLTETQDQIMALGLAGDALTDKLREGLTAVGVQAPAGAKLLPVIARLNADQRLVFRSWLAEQLAAGTPLEMDVAT